jgi:hypothetical protein
MSKKDWHQFSQKVQGGKPHYSVHFTEAPHNLRPYEIMDYHCYYCGIVKKKPFNVPEYEWAISDSGPGDNVRHIYRKPGPDFQEFWAATSTPGGSPQDGAGHAADRLAFDIASEFAAKVNTAFSDQNFNYAVIQKALTTGNGGKSLSKILLDLYNTRGGRNAKPSFSRPCLSDKFASP